jgi:hypothetical protein
VIVLSSPAGSIFSVHDLSSASRLYILLVFCLLCESFDRCCLVPGSGHTERRSEILTWTSDGCFSTPKEREKNGERERKEEEEKLCSEEKNSNHTENDGGEK